MANELDKFDIEDLTLNELRELEGLLCTTLEKAQEQSQALLMQSLLFIMKRREDSEFTMENAGEYSLKDVNGMLGN